MHSHVPLDEAHNDFFGLPSNPLSIYHTGPARPLPSGPQAQRVPKEARPLCTHAISRVWHELGEKIYKFFDSIGLKWTSIDPVRFAEADKEPGPLFLWVGVLPGTLSPAQAEGPAARCKELLSEYAIADVEIAFRESVYTRHAGPPLLDHVSSVDPTADVRAPFTPALGLQIAPKAFPHLEGTGCLYLCEGGASDRVFLLTARHVALPPSRYPNELYHRKDNRTPRREVLHLGGGAFQNALEAIADEIGHWDAMADGYEEELAVLAEHIGGEGAKAAYERREIARKLEEARAAKAGVFEFHRNITGCWSAESQRVLGHVVYAPPISVGTGDSMFTEDWALVELDRAKFDWAAFRGNVVHLGSKLTRYQFMKKMYPHADTRAQFTYPPGGLMQLRLGNTATHAELRPPATPLLDANGEQCLIVVKNGAATGATLGRATGIHIPSFVREYTGKGSAASASSAVHSTSREIAVYPYSSADGAFSAPGDSGAVVADAHGGIVGMITGGAGQGGAADVTYVSAYAFLDERIRRVFPHAYLFLARNPTEA